MLKDGLSVHRATDMLCAIVTDEVCDSLVKQSDWTFDESEEWLNATMPTLVLRDDNLAAC